MASETGGIRVYTAPELRGLVGTPDALLDELDALESLIGGVIDRWTAAAAPHLSGAESVWHRQEVAATRGRVDEALEAVRVAAFDERQAAWEREREPAVLR